MSEGSYGNEHLLKRGRKFKKRTAVGGSPRASTFYGVSVTNSHGAYYAFALT